MTGLTTEITSVTEALTKLFTDYVITHKKAPKSFILGPKEYCQFTAEWPHVENHTFLDVEITLSDKPGLDITPR